ncbi:ribosome silencing factor [Oenococcus sp.]|uniref:ribosome silencing factor n=1 Tax=Oenococcus sp. TaxID=1979414 RepID=UPI0039E8E2BE
MTNKELLERIVTAIDSKKAERIVALDIQNISFISDYFVIASADTSRQVKAIANELIDQLSQTGRAPLQIEGLSQGDWVLIDFGDIVVHLFTSEQRDYYKLEHLWSDAKTIDVSKWVTVEF